MRWLTARRSSKGRHVATTGTGGSDNERGAATIFVALLLVVLMGFAAIAVDVGAMYAERRSFRRAPTRPRWPSRATAPTERAGM